MKRILWLLPLLFAGRTWAPVGEIEAMIVNKTVYPAYFYTTTGDGKVSSPWMNWEGMIAENTRFQFSAGFYETAGITITVDNVAIVGDGHGAAIIRCTNAAGDCIKVDLSSVAATEVPSFTLKDITLEQRTTMSGGAVVNLASVLGSSSIEDVSIRSEADSSAGIAIVAPATKNLLVERLDVGGAGSKPFHVGLQVGPSSTSTEVVGLSCSSYAICLNVIPATGSPTLFPGGTISWFGTDTLAVGGGGSSSSSVRFSQAGGLANDLRLEYDYGSGQGHIYSPTNEADNRGLTVGIANPPTPWVFQQGAKNINGPDSATGTVAGLDQSYLRGDGTGRSFSGRVAEVGNLPGCTICPLDTAEGVGGYARSLPSDSSSPATKLVGGRFRAELGGASNVTGGYGTFSDCVLSRDAFGQAASGTMASCSGNFSSVDVTADVATTAAITDGAAYRARITQAGPAGSVITKGAGFEAQCALSGAGNMAECIGLHLLAPVDTGAGSIGTSTGILAENQARVMKTNGGLVDIWSDWPGTGGPWDDGLVLSTADGTDHASIRVDTVTGIGIIESSGGEIALAGGGSLTVGQNSSKTDGYAAEVTGFSSRANGILAVTEIFGQTQDMQRWRGGSPTVTVAKVDSGGNAFFPTVTQTGFVGLESNVLNAITPLAGQTGDLLQVKDTSGTEKVSIDKDGNLAVNLPDTDVPLEVRSASSPQVRFSYDAGSYLDFYVVPVFGNTAGVIDLVGGTPLFSIQDRTEINADLSLGSVDPAAVELSVKGAPAQAANLQEWRNSSNSVLSFVSSGGYVTLPGAPSSSLQAATKGYVDGLVTTFANPTGSVGLSAVNGSATTAMRSDAAPALSQSIAPTWTGAHTFNTSRSTFNAGVSLGTDGTIQSAVADGASTIAFDLADTTNRTTAGSELFRLRNTGVAAPFDAMAVSLNGEFAFGQASALTPTANAVLAFVQNVGTGSPTWNTGVAGVLNHNSTSKTPAGSTGLNGVWTNNTTNITVPTGSVTGVRGSYGNLGTTQTGDFSGVELAALASGTATGAGLNNIDATSVTRPIAGNWKRVSGLRVGYVSGALSVPSNSPPVVTGGYIAIPGWSSSTGQQNGLFIDSATTTSGKAHTSSFALGLNFPRNTANPATNRTHAMFIPFAAAAGGPAWAPTLVDLVAVPDGSGGLYYDIGTNNWEGFYSHDGTAWRRLVNDELPARVAAGGGTTAAKIGGVIFASTSTEGNTAATETDACSQTIAASTLGANSDSIEFYAAGSFAVGLTDQVKAKFGATTIFDTGVLNVAGAGSWDLRCAVIRTGAATQKATCAFTSSVAALGSSASYTTPAETLSGAVTLKLTVNGTAGNDTKKELCKGTWKPAP